MSLPADVPGNVQRVLIVGAGQAGVEAAFALRQQGYTGALNLIGDEPWLPYRRPPLSKTFLSSATAPDSLVLKPAAAYAKAGIDLLSGVAVTAIRRAARQIELADGQHLPYDRLVLATGGRARRLSLPGEEASNVFTLRSMDDALALRRQFSAGQTLVVIGGGYIGLEVAALARQSGLAVRVLEAAPRLLARVATPLLSAFFAQVHAEAGVHIHLDAKVCGLVQTAGRVSTVRCADADFPADLVLIGVGLQPDTTLATAAGLAVAAGILTDSGHRSSDPAIFAIGDCAEFEHDWLGRRLCLESVPNAMEQGRRVARSLLGQAPGAMPPPWFWSDQYDLKLQSVGISNGFDHWVLRGDPASRSFLAFYFRDGGLIAADAVNRSAEFNQARALVAARATADPAALADCARPLV